MTSLRALFDRLLGRLPPEEPQLTEEQKYEAERKRELLKKHDEQAQRGDDENLIDV